MGDDSHSPVRDRVFDHGDARGSDFEFNEEVASVFDDMLVRSVPGYLEQQALIREIARKFHVSGTKVYDLGCSTGTTLVNIARDLEAGTQLVGYDNSHPMLERAQARIDAHVGTTQIELRHADLNDSLTHLDLGNASVVTLLWTLQFIRPLQRDKLIRKICDNLVDGGILICCEKVLTNDSDMNRFFIDFYYDFKRRNGYTEDEILRKREALENVLVPYRVDENFELFKRNGFGVAEIFFQRFNFAGFLCVKNNK